MSNNGICMFIISISIILYFYNILCGTDKIQGGDLENISDNWQCAEFLT